MIFKSLQIFFRCMRRTSIVNLFPHCFPPLTHSSFKHDEWQRAPFGARNGAAPLGLFTIFFRHFTSVYSGKISKDLRFQNEKTEAFKIEFWDRHQMARCLHSLSGFFFSNFLEILLRENIKRPPLRDQLKPSLFIWKKTFFKSMSL